MPVRNASYVLTPPSLAVFVVSVVIAAVAALIAYAGVKVPIIEERRVFDLLMIAYVVMLAGVVFRRI